MVIASIIFTIGVLLVLIGDRLFAVARKNRDTAFLLRTQQVITPLFWITMGGACLAMSVIQMRIGVVKGFRIGIVPRAEHPFWFWGFTGGLLLASGVIVVFSLFDFARIWQDASRGTNGADDRT